MKNRAITALLSALLYVVTVNSSSAAPGETLAQIKSRGTLRCGVSEGIAGFSMQDAKGVWSGLDVDFCRAVAAAALGDADRVTFVSLRASARFPALLAGQIDLLARNTTWTLLREAGLKIQFAGVLYYDGQAFMIPAKSKIKKLALLKGATVCVGKATTSAQNLADWSDENKLSIKPLVIDSAPAAAAAFFSGACSALTSDASQLAAFRLRAPGGPETMVILQERISKEPLAPAVRAGDDEWFTLVRWVLLGLISLEEAGITRENVEQRFKDPRMRRQLGDDEELARVLDIAPGWSVRTLNRVGNYGEIYERNLGSASPLKLERGYNKLWTQGGLMYAPPLR